MDFADVLIFIGLAAVGAGLAAYDWRVAAVVVGFVLLALGVAGARRGAPATGRGGEDG